MFYETSVARDANQNRSCYRRGACATALDDIQQQVCAMLRKAGLAVGARLHAVRAGGCVHSRYVNSIGEIAVSPEAN